MKSDEKQYELKIPSQTDNLELIRDFVSKVSAKVGFHDDDVDKIQIAVDEACTNVIKHAYDKEGEDHIGIIIKIDYQKLAIIVTDRGKGFDPKTLELPRMEAYLAELRVGGLGIYLMKTLMDEVNYDIQPGVRNEVRMVKYLLKDKNEKINFTSDTSQ
ncbi:MAG: ATP-binding protein [Gemmatimonadota bacterium]|nr:MAG: ATP-binding protein [Gemmatimonadota bacterium]